MKRLKKGVALVEKNGSILVVSKKNNVYSLPGGITIGRETKRQAAYRELTEESGLVGRTSEFFLDYLGNVKYANGHRYRKEARVYVIEASGFAHAQNEIAKVGWWFPGSKMKLSPHTRMVIEKYFQEYYD